MDDRENRETSGKSCGIAADGQESGTSEHGQQSNPGKSKRFVFWANLGFVIFSVLLLWFLFRAPPETTPPVPYDGDHVKFFKMGKKKAEAYCERCHSVEGGMPLPEGHPPKERCLFCHKRLRPDHK